jgi:hypothetical protein
MSLTGFELEDDYFDVTLLSKAQRVICSYR